MIDTGLVPGDLIVIDLNNSGRWSNGPYIRTYKCFDGPEHRYTSVIDVHGSCLVLAMCGHFPPVVPRVLLLSSMNEIIGWIRIDDLIMIGKDMVRVTCS